MENIEYKRAGWRWEGRLEGREDRAGGRQKGKGKVRWGREKKGTSAPLTPANLNICSLF